MIPRRASSGGRLAAAALLLVGIASTGCASRQADLPGDFQFAPGTTTGVIAGSVTSRADTRWSPSWSERSTYYYIGIDDPTVAGVLRSGGNDWPGGWDGSACAAGFPADQCGRLFAVELPAGRYRIHFVQVREPSATSVETGEHFSLALDTLQFEVVGGELRYLGDLHSRICVASFGRSLGAWAARGEVLNAFDRDWPLLADRFPALRGATPIPVVMTSEPWLWRRPGGPEDGWPEACGPYPEAP